MAEPLNRPHITAHLKDAREAIDGLLDGLERDDYDIGELFVEMSHLYHHINTAWNGRQLPDAELEGDAAFERLRQMPPPRDLLL